MFAEKFAILQATAAPRFVAILVIASLLSCTEKSQQASSSSDAPTATLVQPPQPTASVVAHEDKKDFKGVAIFTGGDTSSQQPTIFHIRPPKNEKVRKNLFHRHLLLLALEKTITDFGPYELRLTHSMNMPRALVYSKTHKVENLFFETAYRETFDPLFDYAPIPTKLGLGSYRVCFVREALQQELPPSVEVDQLKNYSFGNGINWADTKILRHNGFKVFEVHDNFHQMVSGGRFDFYCRGLNEIKDEWEAYRHIKGLRIEDSFALYYPLPRYFYTLKSNRLALERVSKGLQMAFEDGTFFRLWADYFLESIEFAKIEKRKIIKLENPLLNGLAPGYDKYFVNPMEALGRAN